jgi:coenzyme F420 hydrogenase subunit beta
MLREYGGITNLEDIVAMDYRGGQWGNMVMTVDRRIRFIASKHDRTWHFLGPASFKRDRCLMCIDWSAEVADMSAGDIFQKVQAPVERLTGILVRTGIGKELIQGAVDKEYIGVIDHNPKLFLSSGLGWEAKKHAGMFRLIQRERFNWPTPDYQYPLKVRFFPREKLAFTQ